MRLREEERERVNGKTATKEFGGEEKKEGQGLNRNEERKQGRRDEEKSRDTERTSKSKHTVRIVARAGGA